MIVLATDQILRFAPSISPDIEPVVSRTKQTSIWGRSAAAAFASWACRVVGCVAGASSARDGETPQETAAAIARPRTVARVERVIAVTSPCRAFRPAPDPLRSPATATAPRGGA